MSGIIRYMKSSDLRNLTKSFVVMFLCVGLGLSITYQTSQKDPIIERDLASLPQNNSSTLNPDFLRQDLAKNFSVSSTVDEKVISFSGSLKDLCSYFSTAKITLQADGVLINGTAPTMNISSPCVSEQTSFSLKIKKAALNQAADVSVWKINKIEFQSEKNKKIIQFNSLNNGADLTAPIIIEN